MAGPRDKDEQATSIGRLVLNLAALLTVVVPLIYCANVLTDVRRDVNELKAAMNHAWTIAHQREFEHRFNQTHPDVKVPSTVAIVRDLKTP